MDYEYTIWLDGKVHRTAIYSKDTAIAIARRLRDNRQKHNLPGEVRLTRCKVEWKTVRANTLHSHQGDSRPVGAARSCPLAYTWRRGA